MTITFTIPDWAMDWISCWAVIYLTLKCVQSILEIRTAYYAMRLACAQLQLAELRASRLDSLIDN